MEIGKIANERSVYEDVLKRLPISFKKKFKKDISKQFVSIEEIEKWLIKNKLIPFYTYIKVVKNCREKDVIVYPNLTKVARDLSKGLISFDKNSNKNYILYKNNGKLILYYYDGKNYYKQWGIV